MENQKTTEGQPQVGSDALLADCPMCGNGGESQEIAHEVEGTRVECECGVCGPWESDYDGAVRSWNDLAQRCSANDQTLPTEGWHQWLVRLWKAVTHSHTWQKLNDASIMDVNDTYPPTHINYVSPKRWCPECGRTEWYVGPEVCGGDRARWVPFSP